MFGRLSVEEVEGLLGVVRPGGAFLFFLVPLYGVVLLFAVVSSLGMHPVLWFLGWDGRVGWAGLFDLEN